MKIEVEGKINWEGVCDTTSLENKYGDTLIRFYKLDGLAEQLQNHVGKKAKVTIEVMD